MTIASTAMPSVQAENRVTTYQIGLLIIFVIALVLRLGYLVITPVEQAYVDDTGWYIANGERMVTNTMTPSDVVPFPPMYSFFTGSLTLWLGRDAGIFWVRVLQAVIGALTSVIVWRIAFRLTGKQNAATLAALGIAINPVFIIENGTLMSETLFIFFLYWGLSVYAKPSAGSWRRMIASGALLGLASLTRAVLVAFPIGLALHVFFVLPKRRAALSAVLILVTYALMLSTWTLYNKVKFDRIVIGGYGISDMLLAATVGYSGSTNIDPTYAAQTGGTVPNGTERDDIAIRIAGETIAKNPLGYVVRQLRQLGEALLQPHNSTHFPGQSLKDGMLHWVREDRSMAGLGTLLRDPTFFPKLLLYIFHWGGLLLGLIGLWLTRRQWREVSVLWGVIVYFLLVHFFLLALPRYLFPIMPAMWVFAGVTLAALFTRRQQTAA